MIRYVLAETRLAVYAPEALSVIGQDWNTPLGADRFFWKRTSERCLDPRDETELLLELRAVQSDHCRNLQEYLELHAGDGHERESSAQEDVVSA